jgi:hypothetical protein
MRALALGFLLAGCSTGLGELCDATHACPKELICRVPPNDGGEPASGICDHPHRTLGEQCSAAAECEPALTCSNHFAPGSRYGECTAKRVDGESCFADRDCESGNCEGASGSQLDGTCKP